MSTPARRRLMRDFKRLQQDPPAGESIIKISIFFLSKYYLQVCLELPVIIILCCGTQSSLDLTTLHSRMEPSNWQLNLQRSIPTNLQQWGKLACGVISFVSCFFSSGSWARCSTPMCMLMVVFVLIFFRIAGLQHTMSPPSSPQSRVCWTSPTPTLLQTVSRLSYIRFNHKINCWLKTPFFIKKTFYL